MSDGIDFPGYPTKRVAQQLAVNRFDATKGTWRETELADSDTRLASLSCVTFNTWFQGEEPDLRYGGLLEALQQSQADVIMLQEATIRLLDALMSADWVRCRYYFTRAPFRADAIPSHGVMLLSRLPIRNSVLHPIPTHMGRSLLTAECRINGELIVLATTHLESMKPYADVRGEQLKTIFGILDNAKHAILAGDFNFCSSWHQENSRIDSRYVDVWPVVHPHEPGYTQDTDINSMLARAKRERKKVRIDRILVRSDSAQRKWLPERVELLGTRPVSPAHTNIFPSDHFGIAAKMRCSDLIAAR
jgi:tyrosyl-DNA phosphodiesterase 2